MKNKINTLTNIFSNINNWLTFAEAKNAAIIAFNSVLLFTIFECIDENTQTNITYYSLLFSIMLIGIGLFISLISFLPKLSSSVEKNNVFFLDINSYENAKQYKKIILSLSSEDLASAYAEEIFYNSKITVNKYKKFRYALYFTMSGLVLFLLAYILHLFNSTII